jgi:hypothetical protein
MTEDMVVSAFFEESTKSDYHVKQSIFLLEAMCDEICPREVTVFPAYLNEQHHTVRCCMQLGKCLSLLLVYATMLH